MRDADDCNIYVRSGTAGRRVMRSISAFLTRRLKLQSVIWKQQRRRSCWRLAGTAVAQDAFPTAYLDTLGLPRLFNG